MNQHFSHYLPQFMHVHVDDSTYTVKKNLSLCMRVIILISNTKLMCHSIGLCCDPQGIKRRSIRDDVYTYD